MTEIVEAPRPGRLRDGINQIAYSADGALRAFSDVHMDLTLPSGQKISLRSPTDKVRAMERVRSLVFTPDGASIVAAAGDNVYQFNTETGELEWSFMIPRVWGFLIISPFSLSISSTGVLAASTDNGQIFVWNSERRMMAKIATNQPQWGIRLLEGAREVVGFESFALNRFDISTGRRLARIELPDKTFGMAFSQDGTRVVARALSKVYMLNGATGELQFERRVGPGLPLLALHPNRDIVAIGEDEFVSLTSWDGVELDRFNLDGSQVISLAFTPDGSRLAIGCSDHQIREKFVGPPVGLA